MLEEGEFVTLEFEVILGGFLWLFKHRLKMPLFIN